MIQVKSRRLAYYNYDEQRTKSRIFSALEIEHANRVFDTIEDILLENDLTIKNKWVTIGRCQCQNHDDTYFMVEVNTDVLEMDVMHTIKEALEDTCKDVKLVDILAKHERRKSFLQLVVLQQQFRL